MGLWNGEQFGTAEMRIDDESEDWNWKSVIWNWIWVFLFYFMKMIEGWMKMMKEEEEESK